MPTGSATHPQLQCCPPLAKLQSGPIHNCSAYSRALSHNGRLCWPGNLYGPASSVPDLREKVKWQSFNRRLVCQQGHCMVMLMASNSWNSLWLVLDHTGSSSMSHLYPLRFNVLVLCRE